MQASDLLNDLSASYNAVGTPVPNPAQAVGSAFQFYTVPILDIIGDDAIRRNVAYYVQDEGQATEAAFWATRPPEIVVEQPFVSRVNSFIAGRIAASVVEAAFVSNIDVANERAIAWALRNDPTSGSLVEIKALLFQDAASAIDFEIVDTVVNVGG